jgi:hypothetical protein
MTHRIPLWRLAYEGDVEAVIRAFGEGRNPEAPEERVTEIDTASDPDLVVGDRALDLAALKGHAGVVRAFVDRFPHCIYTPDDDGYLPVHNAAMGGFVSVLESICAGAHERMLEVLTARTRVQQWTPLHWAAVYCRLAVLVWITDRVPYETQSKTLESKTPRHHCGEFYHLLGNDLPHQCRARLLRVEASLVYPWWPNDLHMLFSDHLKKTIATFRVGTWYLAHMTEYVDPVHAERSLSWLVVSYVMPHIGLGWMAPGWLPASSSPAFAVEDGSDVAASDASASAKRGRDA